MRFVFVYNSKCARTILNKVLHNNGLRIFPSYRIQPIDVQCKSIGWFLSNANIYRKPASIYLFKVNNGNARKIYSKLTIRHQYDVNKVAEVSLLLTLKIFNTLLWSFHCSFGTSRYQLVYIFSTYSHLKK